METQKFQTRPFSTPDQERRRRKREAILIVLIIAIVALLTYVENELIQFGTDIPISNTVLMFILTNINLLLLILLIFLVFRNLVKLFYDRKRRVIGARLRTRLVVAFISLTLLPTIVLFIFAINFITTSIEFWFNVPVEQALNNALRVGRQVYERVEDNNAFFLRRIAYQIRTKKLLEPEKKSDLSHYIKVVQRAFNLDAIEIYSLECKRLTFALDPALESQPLESVSADNLQKKTENNVFTITQDIRLAELIRTIGTIPSAPKDQEVTGYVVVSKMIPPQLFADMKSISKGYEEYQQIKFLKQPVQTYYYLSLTIVGLLVVFCAVWFGFFMAKSITIPIMELAKGTRRVAEGDLGFTIGEVADDEIGSLVDSFNQMTRDLRTGREQIELSARMLRQQNVEIEERRQYMEIVLKNVSTGVITIDAKGVITTVNKSAEKMFDIKPEQILGIKFEELLTGGLLSLANQIVSNLTQSNEDTQQLPLRLTIAGRPRSFLVNVSRLKDDRNRHMGIVMVFDDLTALEKAQRMAAWREVARRIAHEVKNPLTPIKLSAQRLKRKYSEQLSDGVFEECTRMIIDHVDLIRNLVNEFSTFARFPTANPKLCHLLPIIEETVALYREGHPNITFSVSAPQILPKLNLDRQQIKQAMINLVDNAISAINAPGEIEISVCHDETLNKVRIEVADTGVGISDEHKSRLFEPNFSTKQAGTGLGLAIVSTIISDHHGNIVVQDNIPNGARFTIEFPVPA
jgi:two-component system nitrogen regulation sensor histidine kinase NtrY